MLRRAHGHGGVVTTVLARTATTSAASFSRMTVMTTTTTTTMAKTLRRAPLGRCHWDNTIGVQSRRLFVSSTSRSASTALTASTIAARIAFGTACGATILAGGVAASHREWIGTSPTSAEASSSSSSSSPSPCSSSSSSEGGGNFKGKGNNEGNDQGQGEERRGKGSDDKETTMTTVTMSLTSTSTNKKEKELDIITSLAGFKSYLLSLIDSDHASEKETSKGTENKADIAESDDRHNDSSRPMDGSESGRVAIEHDPDLVANLPVMSLDEMRRHDGLTDGRGRRLLVSYDGIVYDVTEFASFHPGGRDLILTASGMDLQHFFDNYTVHGRSDKAARWLAPLAVAKLSPDDARMARELSTPIAHVEKRGKLLKKARRKVVTIAITLPVWMTVRSMVRFVGWFVPPLGRWLAWALPVTVPGLTPGSEPLKRKSKKKKKEEKEKTRSHGTEEDKEKNEEFAGSVAVIGGGIAGCGAAWALQQSGFRVSLYEARENLGGNARTFEWDYSAYGVPDGAPKPEEGQMPNSVRSCVSVTAWPPVFYKNYTRLLASLDIETVPMPLSWFLNSKVPGKEGTLWGADPVRYDDSLRNVFARDFARYDRVVRFSRAVTDAFTLKFMPWRWRDSPSMYDTHTGLGLLNPLTVVPLYSLFKAVGGTDQWWDIVFTPYYTASFLVDELRPFPAVFGPLIEAQIPLIPNVTNTWQGSSKRGERDCNITTCVTWKDAGNGIREVFRKLTKNVDVRIGTRVLSVEVLPNGKKRIHDENDSFVDVDRVIFACPSNAVGNMYRSHSKLADAILSTPVYADDHHPSSGHMHAVMHSDGTVIDKSVRNDVLRRASNYVEVTRLSDGSLNIENQYNFGVQTPGPGVYDLPLDKKPVMLISHSLGEGKSIDPCLIRGTGNHARAHPLYSGWNVMAQLSLRLVQGRDGIYYCSNWTTPGNCHDMSLLSGLVVAHAIGADYPFPEEREARKDFYRLRDLMGV